jgi:farnesyl diphosphate synthase
LAVVKAFRVLRDRDLTEEESKRAIVLGWCIEWLQAFFHVADDIMDSSTMRRGKPCGYKVPKVGVCAFNDSILLRSHVFRLLGLHFASEPVLYARLVGLFLDVTYRTELGQLLDITSQPADAPLDLDNFTQDRYDKIVLNKTAYYTFYLPVALAMALAGVTDDAAFDEAQSLLLPMGRYFQIQDDVLDAFGSVEVIGKVGTDIQDAKCSWLIVQALSRASAEQREVLHKNYARPDEESVDAVKAVYRDLDLYGAFEALEDATYKQLSEQIADVKHVPSSVFTYMLKKTYKRKA